MTNRVTKLVTIISYCNFFSCYGQLSLSVGTSFSRGSPLDDNQEERTKGSYRRFLTIYFSGVRVRYIRVSPRTLYFILSVLISLCVNGTN